MSLHKGRNKIADSTELESLLNRIEELENQITEYTSDTKWIELTTVNGAITPGLASKGLLRYRKIGKEVQIAGSVINVTAGSTVVAYLPVGFRPSGRIDRIQPASGVRQSRCFVGVGGDITVETNDAGEWNAGWWYGLDFSFFID